MKIKMGKIVFSVGFEKELFEKIEEERGLIPRSRFIEYILNKIIKEK